MSRYIHKFEAMSTFDPEIVLKEFQMTTQDLDRMLNTLKEYSIARDLVRDLESSKSMQYRDLRKWKLELYLKAYKEVESEIQTLDSIKDFLFTITDDGASVKISPERGKGGESGTLEIEFLATRLKGIKKLNDITTDLLHLQNRLNIEFDYIDFDSRNSVISLRLDYKLVKH